MSSALAAVTPSWIVLKALSQEFPVPEAFTSPSTYQVFPGFTVKAFPCTQVVPVTSKF